ncbi:carbohydrate-binding domain-containing protein [Enterococcus timonensis]|uniref:carbohydrate-binding domain-containing protein n=1 Tax=Enterococcus timonensis TaxID=1852364 RepID=UPI0008D9C7CB|nr:carbohydrate-binding domain-containing protein [Enterococcus timonensis]
MRKRKIISILLVSTSILLAACQSSADATDSSTTTDSTTAAVDTSDVTMTALALEKEDDLYGDYKEEDYNDDETTVDTTITLADDTATIDGSGASLKGTTLSITKGGNYLISGTFTGTIEVNTTEEVHFILDGVTLTNETGPAINIIEAEKVIVTLAKDSENTISDGADYAAVGSDDPNAAIYSKTDLTFNGSGELTVEGNYDNAIQSKDDLTFIAGTYQITAVNNAIKGKDKVAILDGDFTLTTTSGDAIQASNADETDKGFVAIDGGTLVVDSGSDGIQAETALYVQNATVDITTDTTDETLSAKGLKAGNNLVVDSGTIKISTVDDGLHSDGDVTVNGGDFTIASGDDGIHAEVNLTINAGTIDVTDSVEGIEGENIVINDGVVNIVASDDGVNAAAASTTTTTGATENTEQTVPEDAQGQAPSDLPATDDQTAITEGDAPTDSEVPTENGGTPPERPDRDESATGENADATSGQQPTGGQMGGGGGGGMMEDDGSTLTINGGTLTVDAQGDGLDSNGDIIMTGGTVTVNGPTNSGNGTLDYGGTFEISGGTLLAAGSSGMAQTVSEDSTQVSLAFYLDQATTAKSVALTQNGKTLAEFSPTKSFQQLVFSTSELATGDVTVTIDGTDYQVTLSDTLNSISQDGSAYTATGMGGMPSGGGFMQQ